MSLTTTVTRLRRRTLVALSVLTCVVALPASAPVLHAQAGGIAIGSAAPASFTLATLDGGTLDFSQLIGKRPVVMEFWATWCPLCRKLEPSMQSAKVKYGNQVTFVNIGVPENQSMERQKSYVTERAIPGTFVFDAESRMIKAYQVPHTSYVVVLDRTGRVVYTGAGGDQDIEAAVRKALPAS